MPRFGAACARPRVLSTTSAPRSPARWVRAHRPIDDAATILTRARVAGQPIAKQPLRRPQIKQPKFDPALLHQMVTAQDEWYTSSENCRGIVAFLQNSDVIWNFPKRLVDFLDDKVCVFVRVLLRADGCVRARVGVDDGLGSGAAKGRDGRLVCAAGRGQLRDRQVQHAVRADVRLVFGFSAHVDVRQRRHR